MRFNPFILSTVAAAAVTIGCIVSAASYFYRKRSKEINHVMVFCKLQFNPWNCFDKLMSYIEDAKSSLDVCMPSIHNPAIQGRLVKLIKEKNIKVRIIIDRKGYNDSTDLFLKELLDAGAEIKCRINEPFSMHHKFCLIDDQILMTGTLNWGNDRSSDHWNYVYVTNKPQLLEPVMKEFYQMWSVDVDLKEAIDLGYEDSEEETLASRTESYEDCSVQGQPCHVPLSETQLTPEVCIV